MYREWGWKIYQAFEKNCRVSPRGWNYSMFSGPMNRHSLLCQQLWGDRYPRVMDIIRAFLTFRSLRSTRAGIRACTACSRHSQGSATRWKASFWGRQSSTCTCCSKTTPVCCPWMRYVICLGWKFFLGFCRSS